MGKLGDDLSQIFIYILGVVRGIFYTPVVLSFALFIVVIPLLFSSDMTNPLFQYFPDGHFDVDRLMVLYGWYAFGLSIVISFIEIIFRKSFYPGFKRRLAWLGSLLLVGYTLVFIFMISRANITEGYALFVSTLSFLLSFSAVFVTGLISIFSAFLDKTLRNK